MHESRGGILGGKISITMLMSIRDIRYIMPIHIRCDSRSFGILKKRNTSIFSFFILSLSILILRMIFFNLFI